MPITATMGALVRVVFLAVRPLIYLGCILRQRQRQEQLLVTPSAFHTTSLGVDGSPGVCVSQDRARYQSTPRRRKALKPRKLWLPEFPWFLLSVPPAGIEPATRGLKVNSSATELRGRNWGPKPPASSYAMMTVPSGPTTRRHSLAALQASTSALPASICFCNDTQPGEL